MSIGNPKLTHDAFVSVGGPELDSRRVLVFFAWRFLGILVLLIMLVPTPAGAAVTAGAGFEILDVAPAWSGHPVGFAIETTDRWQYVAFYDAERRMTIAQRSLDGSNWTFQRLSSVVGWDSHNYIAMAVDTAGFVHVSGNMHGDPLVYFRSSVPHDISAFEQPGMVGRLEKRVSYPHFLQGGDGQLFFQYRDGKSGDGVQLLNAYDLDSKRWRRHLAGGLLDGGGAESAYSAGPSKGPDGYFHLVWMWRDNPSGATNHDLSYARSRDLLHWETASGERLELPIRPDDREALVDPVGSGEGLAGIAFGVGWDARSRPIVTYSKYDTDGRSQAYNARWSGREWQSTTPSDWTYRWDLARTGSLHEAIVVRPPTIDAQGRLVQQFRHIEQGSGLWVLEEETLARVEVLPEIDDLRRLKEPESSTPGMEVREFVSDRRGEYFLRWETLPINRDRPRKPPYPEPSPLRVYRRTTGGRPSIGPSRAKASADNQVAVPDGAVLEADGARIGVVSIQVGNIFDESDPTEDKKMFRLVNRFRLKTREQVIRRELLFASGDPYSQRLLEESERLLRSRGYLYEAEIRPTAYRSGSEDQTGEVDVVVKTRDVWTLTGGVSLARSGGENSTRFHIDDTNFLGLGKEMGISRESDVERVRSEFKYRDFNVLGSRAQMEISIQENSDGYRRLLKLSRPFFSLDTQSSKGFSLLSEDRIDPLFERGEIVSEFGHQIERMTVARGFSRGLQEGTAQRWSVGFAFLRDRYTQIEDRPTADLPTDRTTSYPWVGFDWIEDRFIEVVDLDTIASVEDLNLGTMISAWGGWSSPVFGGDQDEALAGFEASSGFHPSEGKLLLIDGNGTTRWSNNGFENTSLAGRARFYSRNWGRHAFFAEIQAAAVRLLDAKQQLLIGGDSGLRGYPLRFQSGDRRLLLSLEQRFYSKREVFKLARFGAAVFFDIGRAWFVGADSEDDLGVLRDAGFGLRLVPTRSSGKTVFHMDVAFPFDAGGSIESIQYLLTTKETF